MRHALWVSCLAMACAGSEAWRGSVTPLSVEGVAFLGDRTVPETWSGVGVWVAPDVLLTSATTALRAQRIAADSTPSGRRAQVERFVAYDAGLDAALLGTPGPGLVALGMDPEVGDVVDVVVTGEVSERATVVALSGDGPRKRLVLDRALARGALVFTESGAFSGILSGAAETAVGVPRSALAPWIAGRGPGVPLDGLFTLEHAATWMTDATERAICLKPGEALKLPLTGEAGSDLFVEVAPEAGAPGVALGLTEGRAVPWKGLLTERRTFGFARSTAGLVPRDILLVNPARSDRPACLTVRLGGVAWNLALGPSGFKDTPAVRLSAAGGPP